MLDDDEVSNSTIAKVVEVTVSTIQGSTVDPTPDDDDEEISEPERKDEINDSK